MARILSIAGSDSGGGAGVQIDIKTAQAIGCESSTAITAITAQNRAEVRGVELVSLAMIEAQMCAVLDEIPVDAVKIGMLGSADVARVVGGVLARYAVPFIVADPVLIATSGGVLGARGTAEAIVEHIVPRCTLLTPNIDEAVTLSGIAIDGTESYDMVWEFFRQKGLHALLLKGGHAQKWQGDSIVDTLYTKNGLRQYVAQRIETRFTHGTGCTLSTAIASYLALGHTLFEAVGLGVDFVQNRLRQNNA